jgi:hypothetical protein
MADLAGGADGKLQRNENEKNRGTSLREEVTFAGGQGSVLVREVFSGIWNKPG